MKRFLQRTAAIALLTLAACAAPVVMPDPPAPSAPPAATVPAPGSVPVKGVPHDGDTFRIAAGPVRLLGIDAPEVPGDCYGPEAAVQVQEMLTNNRVTLQSDPEQGDRDRYGRLLRYVSTQDVPDLSLYLLQRGLARVYMQYPVARTPEYLAAEQTAKRNKVGGWNVCQWN